VKKRRKMPNNLVHCNQDSTDDDDCSWVYDDLEKKRLHTNNTTTTTNWSFQNCDNNHSLI
jgi:hypothetical protein